MSLTDQISTLATEVGTDIKALRSQRLISSSKSGRRVAADNPSGNSLGIANAIANSLRFNAIVILKEKPISAFCVYVSVVGVSVRLGLYSDTNEYPGSLLWDSGDISLSATGLVRVSSGLPFSVLAAGTYWVALNFYSSAGQLRVQPVSGTLFGVDLTAANNQFSSLSKSYAFGEMPSSAPTDLSLSASSASSPLFFES